MEESLGLSLVRSSRAKVFPQQGEQFEGYVGERDVNGVPHGTGTLTINDGSLLWMGGAYGADSDGIGNGVYEGEFVHGKVNISLNIDLLMHTSIVSINEIPTLKPDNI